MEASFRWRLFVEGRPRPRDLVEFHTVNKYELLARDPDAYVSLGRLVARADEMPLEEYGDRYLRAMEREPTPGSHRNVLEHLAGMLGTGIPEAALAEVRRSIQRYGLGEVPVAEPVTLIRAQARAAGLRWVAQQTYLERFAGWEGETLRGRERR